jgi:predicted ATPase
MITRFSVESFKSLEKVEVELGSVNVFVGANGSGKSNLLEAIGVLGAAAFGRVDDESLLRRGVRPGSGRNGRGFGRECLCRSARPISAT